MKRKWWVALLLTFFASGAGYLYSGHPRRFLAFVSVNALVLLTLVFVGFRLDISPVVVLVFLCFLQLIIFAMIFDSAIAASRQHNFKPRWFNKMWVYILSGIIGISANTALINNKKISAIRSYSVPSVSMAPTLMVGDYFFADTYAYKSQKPKRGDVVVFKLTKNPKVNWVKRIVGSPRDKVQFVDGQLHLNGKPVAQNEQKNPYTQKSLKTATIFLETLPSGISYKTASLYQSKTQGIDNTKVFLVPGNHYFVSGDNRDNSYDSRFADGVGFVLQKNIYAKGKIIFWSTDWNRIGTLLNPK